MRPSFAVPPVPHLVFRSVASSFSPSSLSGSSHTTVTPLPLRPAVSRPSLTVCTFFGGAGGGGGGGNGASLPPSSLAIRPFTAASGSPPGHVSTRPSQSLISNESSFQTTRTDTPPREWGSSAPDHCTDHDMPRRRAADANAVAAA